MKVETAVTVASVVKWLEGARWKSAKCKPRIPRLAGVDDGELSNILLWGHVSEGYRGYALMALERLL